ncbi:MAG: DUF4279 domain-containing protein [Dehalococcoidia bacterium]
MALVPPEYIDDYGTCARTYATFCIYHDALDPEMLSAELGIEPTDAQKRGEVGDPQAQDPFIYTTSGWFLSSEGAVESRDARRHIDWLLDRLEPGSVTLQKLQRAGCRMEVSCYWLSRSGNGGPTLSPHQMARLATLGLEIEFDAYAMGDDDNYLYLARSLQAINEFARERATAPAPAGAVGEGSQPSSRVVFPVVRVDLAVDPRVPLDVKTDVTDVFTTPEAAWREANRLNELHAGRGCKFLWKCATLWEKPREEEL